MHYDAAAINRFDLARYPDYRGDFPPDVYQLHRFGHLEEYEAEWGRRWGANGIGRLRDVALSRPTEYEVLDLWLKHPKFFLLRYSSRIDLDALVRNHEAYDALLRSLGIDVHWIEYDHPFARGRVGGTVLINHFTADLCRSYQYDLSARGLAISTIRLRLATLGSFGKWAVRRERVDKNPLDLLTRPQRKERLPHVPRWATVEKIIAQSSGRRQQAILALMAYGVLRRSEVVALDVGDYASGFGLTRVTGKGGDETGVPLPRSLETS